LLGLQVLKAQLDLMATSVPQDLREKLAQPAQLAPQELMALMELMGRMALG